MSPRRVVQLALEGTHHYVGVIPTRVGYRARCACGWRSSRRNQARSRRSAVALWQAHVVAVNRGV